MVLLLLGHYRSFDKVIVWRYCFAGWGRLGCIVLRLTCTFSLLCVRNLLPLPCSCPDAVMVVWACRPVGAGCSVSRLPFSLWACLRLISRS